MQSMWWLQNILCIVRATSYHRWMKSGQWRAAQFLSPLLCLTADSLLSQEMMSPWSRPVNHADELTWTACMASYLPAVRPDCTFALSSSVSPAGVSCISNNNNPLYIHSLALSLTLSGWAKPGGERFLTGQQINVCISADWFISLVLFD